MPLNGRFATIPRVAQSVVGCPVSSALRQAAVPNICENIGMNDVTIPLYESNSRWRFDWILPVLFRPRRTFAQMVQQETAVSHTPLFLLVLTALINALVIGGLKQAALASGQPVLPPGFEYYTPEQQAQYFQAANATSGPVFTYLLPAVMAVISVYVVWLVTGWVLHLLLTLMGGRNSSRQVLNLTAWAMLPFALRTVVRIVAMWLGGQQLTTLGLSGFAPTGEGNLPIFLTALLALVDIYLIWHIVLLIAAARAGDTLSRGKAITAVFITILGLYLLRALPALLAAQFSDLTVIRPFF